MKSDLDRLMTERRIDAAVIMGQRAGNPTLYYMVNGAKISSGTLIKKRGEPPVLLYHAMERDEAAKSGLETIDMNKYDFVGLLRAAEGNRLKAAVQLMGRLFHDRKISGRVAFYGTGDSGAMYVLLRAIDASIPNVRVVGEYGTDIFTAARSTKEPDEVARIREVARKTVAAVDATLEFLRAHPVRDGILIGEDHTELTVGDVKRYIRRKLFDQDLVEEIDTILAVGRDAGIPHAHGNDDDVVRLGQAIVFDVFPRERGGGYFFDMTRTFCLGYAPAEMASVFDDVQNCFNTVVSALEAGAPVSRYHELACEFFEAHGHPTMRSDPGTEQGYVHPLGHGIGLSIHEQPFLHDVAGTHETLKAGAVFTIEPGLYYPNDGFGIRLEDVYYLDEQGIFHNLTNYPKELVIEMRASV